MDNILTIALVSIGILLVPFVLLAIAKILSYGWHKGKYNFEQERTRKDHDNGEQT